MYFDASGSQYFLQELLNKIKDKFGTYNIFRRKSNNSIMRGFSCVAIIEYMVAGKTLLNHIKRKH